MSLDQAVRLYEDFRGFSPRKFVTYDLPDHEQFGADIGTLDLVGYTTKRDGAPSKYVHEFDKNSAPRIAASADGKQLYVVGGNYEFTEEGITDMGLPLVVANPRKRKKGKSMAKKSKRRAAKRAAPAKTIIVHENPRRRKRAKKAATKIIYRSKNPSRRGGKMGLGISSVLIPAAIETGGAIGVSMATAMTAKMLNKPALATGPMGAGLKVAFGLAAGLGISMLDKKAGESVLRGALVIAGTDLLKAQLQSVVAMNGFVGNPGLNGFVGNPGLGAYQQADDGTWYQVVDEANMGAYTASTVAPDQDGPWNNGLQQWVNN